MHFYHFGVFDWKNAGDTVLGQVTEDLIDNNGCWEKWPIYGLENFPEELIGHINRNVDIVVIGGGGFFIPGKLSMPSGWHCPLSLEQLRRIRKPIVVFGVGNSRFWGQCDFNELFILNINQLVEQSAFFSLRNFGSMITLSRYLKRGLVKRLEYQPDPTTILPFLYPEYQDNILRENEIALEPALDSLPFRFGDRQEEILNSIAVAMRELSRFNIKLVIHRGGDEYMAKWLDKARVEYKIVNLDHKPSKEVLDFYAGCPLTIGMRGHGVMIPFGMGNPFVPLISHDKIRFFLDDIGERGIDVRKPNLTERIVERVNQLNRDVFRERIIEQRQRLWEVTQGNLEKIRMAIGR